jgi:hypothetical protein
VFRFGSAPKLEPNGERSNAERRTELEQELSTKNGEE